MVEKIVVAPNEVRGYGNIVDNDKDKSDLCFYNSFVNADTDLIDGIRIGIMRMIYQDPNLFFSFHQLEKYLYVNSDDMTLSFDSTNKCLVFDDTTESFSLGFDSTDKVLYIGETGEHDYSIAFSQSSYTASGGSATLEITLLDSNVPVQSASVTVTGSDSSSYTGLTNNDGIAQVTVSNISGTVTFTCTYGNVSDTCTVTVQSGPLFFDDCASDKTSLYDTTTNWTKSSFLFDSTNSCYAMSRTSSPSGMCTLWIKDLTVTDQVKITVDMKIGTSGTQNTQAGPIVMNSAKNKGFLTMIESWSSSDGEYSLGTINAPTGSHGTKVVNDQSLGVNAKNYWLTYELIIDGSSVELNIYNGSTKIKTGTVSSSQLDSTGNIVGFLMSYDMGAKVYLKNLKVEAL